ncbi:MAG: vWA domain-containing protein, partial [Planctomycetaceae bacterium]
EFHKVYEELGIQQSNNEDLKKKGEVLTTSILGFGNTIHVLTPQPTGDVKKIQRAIQRIGIDRSGNENMCQSIAAALDQFTPLARKQKRQLIVVVVSDESPTDNAQIEQAIVRVKKAAAPIYILGREAIFGYPFARLRWKDPVYGLNHWVRIDRGPETAYPECLQYDGMHARWDSFSSGFGPYAHVRLAKHSGGIFFMLPGEEEALDGPGAHEDRRFAALAMKEYEPLLLARREYAQQVLSSPFRTVISNIIARLNPNKYPQLPKNDPKLNIQRHHYSIEAVEFRNQAREAGQRTVRAMALLSEAIALLDKNDPLRAGEDSQRWRANFDLIRAQCYAYRVRLFQFLLVLDQHAVDFPKPKGAKTNRWHFNRSRQMRTPDEAQYKRVQAQFRTKKKREVFLEALKTQQGRATQLYELVLSEHPGTPWARRANWELNAGYGMSVHEGFHDPRYRDVGTRIKVPKF